MPAPSLPKRSLAHDVAPQVAPSIVYDVLRSPGDPLDASTRAFMEPRFGYDFGQVRIHSDRRAHTAATALKAHAFTVGCDMVFAEEQFAPHTNSGRMLIAHELTHVVQQSSMGTAVQRQVAVDDPVSEPERAVGVVLDEPGSPGAGLTIKVQIVSGSKPSPHHPEEEKIYGGKKGGHVVIDIGQEGVLGFSNDATGGHFFARPPSSQNSKFEHYSQEAWNNKIAGKQVITYEIEVTPEQLDAIKEAFSGEPEVDYSVLGYRCASYALHALKEAGVIDNSDFNIKYFLAVTPGAIAKFLKNKGYTPTVQPGSKTRRWNRFKGPTGSEPASK
jgi:hypothetical protein